MEHVGKIVRVGDWPGTHGERYLVVESYKSKAYGACVWARRMDKGVPGPWTCFPVACIRSVDMKANRTWRRAIEITQSTRSKKKEAA